MTRRFSLPQAAPPLQGMAIIALFAISAILTAVTAVIALSGDGGPGDPVVFWLLGLNFLLILGLAGATLWRMRALLYRARGEEPAPRLHRHFVTLFAAAAIVPAVLIALFFGGFLTRGLETWFSERVESSVESVASVAQFSFRQIVEQARVDMLTTASDLNEPDIRALYESSPEQFEQYLEAQARRSFFQAAYIVDETGEVLVGSVSAAAPEYRPPDAASYAEAREDILVNVDRERRRLTALYALDGYPGAYLYAIPDISDQQFEALESAEAAITSFRTARAERGRIQLFFGLIYAETMLLVLSGAAWLGLAAAGRVVTPVGRLVQAADQIRRGDLTARVRVGREQDELAALSRAFNRMSRQLEEQRRDLLVSNKEAESRRRLIEAVLTGVSAGVISVGQDGVMTLANSSAETLLGAEPGGLIGRPLREIAPDLDALSRRAQERPDEIAESQIELVTDEGGVTLNARAAAETAPDGVVITFDDITRLIAAQRNAAWRDVARRIAHEIKNPLTPIQLSAERLRRRYRPQDEAQVEVFDNCIQTITRQVDDIGRMVNEFSSFARMPTPRVEPVGLRALAKEALFARRVASPGIDFVLEGDSEEIVIQCDERLAGQALANVLKNASESVTARVDSGNRADRGRIAVRLSRRAGFGVIEVEDNGLGWPEGERDRMTEPYMTTREKGTGLGLAIVKRVMEDHAGALELDDPAEGPGAIVRLVFPLSETNAGRERPAAE